jgi:hypothetical protein
LIWRKIATVWPVLARNMRVACALEFPDGNIVLLTRLYEGQNATVLTLPTRPKTAAEAEAQQRVAYVV